MFKIGPALPLADKTNMLLIKTKTIIVITMITTAVAAVPIIQPKESERTVYFSVSDTDIRRFRNVQSP
jgi:hypothetical protein